VIIAYSTVASLGDRRDRWALGAAASGAYALVFPRIGRLLA
jgi:hypothetical protein